MNKTFHQRFTLVSKGAIAVATALVFYLFWIKQGLVGVAVMLVTVGMIERVLHTEYKFESDADGEWLIIDRGRLSFKKVIKIADIKNYHKMNGTWGLSKYWLIEYGAGKFVGVQPQNEDAFIEELEKRINK